MPDEQNEDYEKIFGQGGSAAGGGETEEAFLFDPTEAGPGALPEGSYRAVVAEPPVKQISQNGNPMFKTTFQVTDGPFTGSLQWKRFMLAGKGGTWTKEFLEAVDLKEEAEGTKPIVPRVVEGRHCIIDVRVQKNNSDYMEVWRVRPHPGGPSGVDTDSPF